MSVQYIGADGLSMEELARLLEVGLESDEPEPVETTIPVSPAMTWRW